MPTRALIAGVAAMATIVVVSNILVQFLLGDWLTWGALTYPFAFLVTDLMNRLHGPAAARRIVFAGFLVGVIENLAGTYLGHVGAELKLSIALVVIILVLVVKPEGLLGRKIVQRV